MSGQLGNRETVNAGKDRKDGGAVGAPIAELPAFCAWLFDCLGMVPGDSLEDLFPGTGIVARAWRNVGGRSTTSPVDGRQ